MSLYSITNGTFAYQNVSLFTDVSFSLSPFDRIVLRGVSGIGKSTLLQLIFGMKQWGKGDEVRQGSIHFHPQHDLLLPWKTVRENLEFTLGKRAPISSYLELVHLRDAEKKYPQELSQGMKQRVAFLRTLLSGKDLLLFDEPFANLDPELGKTLSMILKQEQKKRGFATIVVTHSELHQTWIDGTEWNILQGKVRC